MLQLRKELLHDLASILKNSDLQSVLIFSIFSLFVTVFRLFSLFCFFFLFFCTNKSLFEWNALRWSVVKTKTKEITPTNQNNGKISQEANQN